MKDTAPLTVRTVHDHSPTVGASRCMADVAGLPCWRPKRHDGDHHPLPARDDAQRRAGL